MTSRRAEVAATAHGIDRRTALKVVAAAPFLAPLVWAEPEVMEAQRKTALAFDSGNVFVPQFFTDAEWKTVRMLSDLIIPRDKRSGSATDARVPEFMDFMIADRPGNQKRIRDGLAWLDTESQTRCGKIFVECNAVQHAALLDVLAWPKKAPESMKDAVAFFISFRNLVLSGFWSSRMGVEDLQYTGNTFVPHWNGCPPEALKKLGVSYDG